MVLDCLFCRMAVGEIAVEKLYDDDLVFAVRDINPRAPAHVLVIPKEHIATARDLTVEQAPCWERYSARRTRSLATSASRTPVTGWRSMSVTTAAGRFITCTCTCSAATVGAGRLTRDGYRYRIAPAFGR